MAQATSSVVLSPTACPTRLEQSLSSRTAAALPVRSHHLTSLAQPPTAIPSFCRQARPTPPRLRPSKALPYDPIKDFTNIGLIATAPAVLSVNAALPTRSIADLVGFAKSHADQLNYGSAGIGSPGHLWGEMFRQATGSPMIHVPYKGTGPAMTDLISGQIQVLLDGLPSQISNIKAGTIRPLAAMSEQRSPLLPDVPTMREAGYPTVHGGLWFGLSGPADLPQDIVSRLSAGLATLDKDEGFAAKLQSTGVLVTLLPPDGYRKLIENEISHTARSPMTQAFLSTERSEARMTRAPALLDRTKLEVQWALRAFAALTLIAIPLVAPVRAAEWPNRPLTMVIPFAAGGPMDYGRTHPSAGTGPGPRTTRCHREYRRRRRHDRRRSCRQGRARRLRIRARQCRNARRQPDAL